MTPYYEISGLQGLYLEDSYILHVDERAGVFEIQMDLVLTPDHSEYELAKPGEKYCYRRGVLAFGGVERVDWTGPGLRPSTDASGEADFGNIDSLVADGRAYRIEGDFGQVVIVASSIDVTLSKI